MPALIERPKMTRTMYQALKRHIMKEREKKKQEQEQGALLERIRKETEIRKKNEQEASLTLEQTKEQIQDLEKKLSEHKTEKHELFSELKRVLQTEEDARRQATLREQSELLSLQPTYPHPIQGVSSHHPMLLNSMAGRPALYKPPQRHVVSVSAAGQAPVKRPRSPSPTLGMYTGYDSKYSTQSYGASKLPPSSAASSRYSYEPTTYQQMQSSHVTYPNQSGQLYQQQACYVTSQSPARKFTPANHSAFTTYPSHYAQHQKHLPETMSAQYQMRITQPPYMGTSPHQSKQPGQKSGYGDDKYQSHSRNMAQGVLPRQQAPLLTHAVPASAKGSYSVQQGPPGRGQYGGGQSQTRYF